MEHYHKRGGVRHVFSYAPVEAIRSDTVGCHSDPA